MESIKSKAFALLAKKAYFSKQLRLKLIDKGYPENEIEALITELKERGWVNDQELAARFVLQCKARGYGSKMIAYKLREKAGPIEVPIAESEEDLIALIHKKYARDLAEKQPKVINALLRRGYSYDLINKVLKNLQ